MEEVSKRFNINDNRILIYQISDGYATMYTITEGFLKDNNPIKTYSLNKWDDYGFDGWINNSDNVNQIKFEFDINHPLYMPLFHLLNYDKELIIDDDDTHEYNKKIMRIYIENKVIYIEFINNLTDSEFHNYSRKFQVFIKNIVFDGRSKIDQDYKDTKYRLADFFNEVKEILLNDEYQLSIEKCLIDELPSNEINEYKKVFKKDYKRRNI